MTNSFEPTIPSDIRLLLRADAEQHWLHREVIPVLREVEALAEIPEEQVDAALAYLEATWSEATVRARETDAAHSSMCLHEHQREALWGPASRYTSAVRVLREILADRVTPFVEPAAEFEEGRGGAGEGGLRVTDRRPDGCPRAA